MQVVFRFFQYLCLAIGLSILSVSLFGLTQSLRPSQFFSDELRFGAKDILLSLEEYQQQVIRLPGESDAAYAKRVTKVIADGTAHIHWERFDPAKFNQIVPIWENWILYFMGRFSGIPEYERYHFVNPDKSIERGIGLCGEVSMVLTSLLERNGIEASMMNVPGHVVVTAEIDGQTKIFDPDFGVVIPFSPEQLKDNVDAASQLYVDAGYTRYDKMFFQKAYSTRFTLWDGPEHFITTKYYFEKVSYWLMWIIPLCLIVFSWLLQRLLAKR